MDSDSDKQKENSDPLPGNLPVYKSTGIRCSIRSGNEMDRRLLGDGYPILLWCSVFSWIVFLLF